MEAACQPSLASALWHGCTRVTRASWLVDTWNHTAKIANKSGANTKSLKPFPWGMAGFRSQYILLIDWVGGGSMSTSHCNSHGTSTSTRVFTRRFREWGDLAITLWLHRLLPRIDINIMTAFILAAEVISSLSLASELSLEPFLQDDFDGNNGSSSWTLFFFGRFRQEQQEIDIEIVESNKDMNGRWPHNTGRRWDDEECDCACEYSAIGYWRLRLYHSWASNSFSPYQISVWFTVWLLTRSMLVDGGRQQQVILP